jgi:hypothetical protein
MRMVRVSSKFEKMKEELKSLVVQGNRLYYSMVKETQGLPENLENKLKEMKVELPNFSTEYDSWYSEALAVIHQILPSREADFIKQYKDEKRKDIDYLTYGIADYLLGLVTRYGGKVVADGKAAIKKMEVQNSILQAAEKRFESSLFDIQEVLQADIFDSELGAANELAKKGFVRGAGAIAGVVLEKHQGHVCSMHNHKSRKKHPTIADFNEILKNESIIDTAKWRFIQHLADIRNLCDHHKDREPTKDDALELIEGVAKVIKTVS